MQCDLCGKPGTRFIRVNHEKYGNVFLCDDCVSKQKEHLLSYYRRYTCGCQ